MAFTIKPKAAGFVARTEEINATVKTRLGSEPITYIPAMGETVTISAIITRGEYDQEITRAGEYLLKTAKLMIAANSESGVATPQPFGDKLQFDGVEWELESYEPDGFGSHLLQVTRRELVNRKVRR